MKLTITIDMEGRAMSVDPIGELSQALEQVLSSLEKGGTEGHYIDEDRHRIGEWAIA